MADDEVEVRVAVAGASPETTTEGALLLRGELGQLDINDIADVPAGDAPPGAKGVELLALGAMVVKFARSSTLLRQMVDAVRDWVSRNDAQSVRLEIDGDVLEVTGASSADRRELIDLWVARHSDR